MPGSWRRRDDVMRAVDTNVIVRYLTGDDEVQATRARAVVDAGQVFVSTTVLLESEWVLRSVYAFSKRLRSPPLCVRWPDYRGFSWKIRRCWLTRWTALNTEGTSLTRCMSASRQAAKRS